MSCCLNKLGSFPHNKDINTGIEAPASGMYELMFTGPNFTRFTKYLTFAASDDIVIPEGILNEDMTYSLVITKPDGDLLEVDACSNFSLTTYVNKVVCDELEYL